MKVLVAGGAGYIGSHTVKKLLKQKFEVFIYDNFSSGKKELIHGGEVIKGDLHDKEDLRAVFKKNKIDAVLHFASLIQVGESYINPHKYYSHNLLTSLNLLEVMKEFEVDKFIFSSSAAVYGVPKEIPISESHPLKPANPYGNTKMFVEKILEDYRNAYEFNYISLRYFNASGADPDGELGEMHDPETHLIPNILLSILDGRQHFHVFGNDFDTPDHSAIRDYIHVTDLANAHVLALQKLFNNQKSRSINLGANKGYSVFEIMKMVEQITHKSIHYTIKPRRKGDVPVLLASNETAKQFLGWKPQYSDIETIIQTAWNWHKKRQ